MGRFEIIKDHIGQHRFRLTTLQGALLLASEGYTMRPGMEQGIANVRRSATLDERYEAFMTEHGYAFVLKAANQEPLAHSVVYPTAEERDACMLFVKRWAAEAQVIDLSR